MSKETKQFIDAKVRVMLQLAFQQDAARERCKAADARGENEGSWRFHAGNSSGLFSAIDQIAYKDFDFAAAKRDALQRMSK